jgi:hypothetical protein
MHIKEQPPLGCVTSALGSPPGALELVEDARISLEDCIAFCGLDKDEVSAISEHEHIPEIAATALADYLLDQPHGVETIRTMIIDDIHKALGAGRVRHAQELFMALRHFLDQHLEARARRGGVMAQHANRMLTLTRMVTTTAIAAGIVPV